ncbi:MAG: glycosyltransferase family 4 protein [Alphaproteobacteria bacterium]|nr:glycosyltransferase family 4 protein [Alphaproteobacteria bacterium]
MSAQQQKPVILQIIPSLGAGGAEQGCIDIAAELRRAGAVPLVVSNGGGRVHELARLGVQHINLPVDTKNPWRMWRNAGALSRLIRQNKVNIVHVRSRAPAWSAYWACRRTRTPLVTTVHAPYNINGMFKRWYNSIMTSGDRVIAISESIAQYLRENYFFNHDKIRVIPRGIALEKFHPTAVTPERLIALSRQWRLPEGANIVMLPGRLTRWKGQHVLIDALALLGRRDVFGLIIGDDQGRKEYRRELEQSIAEKNLGGRVRIVDHCADMPAAYMLATIVISASTDPEGFGRVVVESQAMGRLTIASNHGGAKETLIEGQTGWLVTPGDPQALSKAIEEALSLPAGQRAILATRAMTHVATHFTRELMADKTLDVYAELLKANGFLRLEYPSLERAAE